MLGDNKYEKRDKNRKVHIWWDDFWIEDVCFDGVNYENHEQDTDDSGELSIAITDDNDRDSWENRSKYGDKSEDEYDKWEGKDKRKGTISYHKTDDDESDDSENSVHKGDDGLRLEYSTKSTGNFGSNDSVFTVEETEVPIFHKAEKSLYFVTFYNEDIRENNSYKELHKDRTSILDIDECSLKHIFDILLVQKVRKEFFCSETYAHLALYLGDEFLSLCGKSRSIFYEIFYFIPDSRYEAHKKDDNNTHKCNIEDCYHDIGCCIFCSKFFGSCLVSMESPVMELLCKNLSSTEEEISEDEGDKKECKKVAEEISNSHKKRKCKYLFKKFRRKDKRKKSFKHGIYNRCRLLYRK